MLNFEKMILAGFAPPLAQEALNYPELVPAEMHAALSDGDYAAPEPEALPPVLVLEDEPELPPVMVLEDETIETPVLEVKLSKAKK